MTGFRGFDDDKTIPLPVQFFTDLLPTIEDRAELIVTLYVLWLHAQQGDKHPFFRARDLAQDRRFYQNLKDPERTPAEALQEGLERAVARGTLLHVRARAAKDTPEEDWYCLNTVDNRTRLHALARGDRPHVGSWALTWDGNPPKLNIIRPNIFTLYEQNIGLLQPLIADELREAEREYPPQWIEDAFRIAAQRNVRNWKYVRAILERWAREGRDHEENRRRDSQDPERYISGPYAHLIEH